MTTEQLTHLVTAALEDRKALGIKVLDVRRLTSVTDCMVIAGGTSTRHVQALAHHVLAQAAEAGVRPLSVEGLREAEWVLVDLADVIVHVMLPATRDFYQLEKLWNLEEPSLQQAGA